MTEELDINDVTKCFASLGYQVVAEPCDPNSQQVYSVIDAKTKVNVHTNFLLFYGQGSTDIINWTIDELRYALKKVNKFWTPWMGETKINVDYTRILYTSHYSFSNADSFPKVEALNPFKGKSPHEMLITADMINDPGNVALNIPKASND